MSTEVTPITYEELLTLIELKIYRRLPGTITNQELAHVLRKIARFSSDIEDDFLTEDDINNTLTSIVSGSALDARQGKVLKDLIDILDSDLIEEMEDREDADDELQSNINTEIQARIDADNDLQDQLDNVVTQADIDSSIDDYDEEIQDGVPEDGNTLGKLYDKISDNIVEKTFTSIANRNAYNVPALPYQAYVTNDGDAHWALYKALSTGINATYIKIADQDAEILSAAEIKILYESNANTNPFTDADVTKLEDIEEEATANFANTYLLARANHTGTQTVATLSDFVAGVNTSITANTILTKIKTVDGAGSGLDADLLDSHEAAYFATQTDLTTGLALKLSLAGGTMSGAVLMGGGSAIDSTLSGGSDVLNIGTSNADIINIGWSGATINMTGTLAYQNVTNLTVTDKLIRLNVGGGAASGVSSGFEIEENGSVAGYFATDSARTGWDFKSPNSFQLTLGLDLLSANRIIKMPNAAGTIALLSSISATSPIFYSNTTGIISSQAAGAAASGYVTTGVQTLAGNKTFSGQTTFENGIIINSDQITFTPATGIRAFLDVHEADGDLEIYCYNSNTTTYKNILFGLDIAGTGWPKGNVFIGYATDPTSGNKLAVNGNLYIGGKITATDILSVSAGVSANYAGTIYNSSSTGKGAIIQGGNTEASGNAVLRLSRYQNDGVADIYSDLAKFWVKLHVEGTSANYTALFQSVYSNGSGVNIIGGSTVVSTQPALYIQSYSNADIAKYFSNSIVFYQPLTVPDDAYDATSWNGNLTVPTKNAVRDKIEAASGANTALSNLASVAINTALVLGTSDAAALGSTTKMWSDLFLAAGGVINWNNGNVTLTHSTGILALAGSLLADGLISTTRNAGSGAYAGEFINTNIGGRGVIIKAGKALGDGLAALTIQDYVNADIAKFYNNRIDLYTELVTTNNATFNQANIASGTVIPDVSSGSDRIDVTFTGSLAKHAIFSMSGKRTSGDFANITIAFGNGIATIITVVDGGGNQVIDETSAGTYNVNDNSFSFDLKNTNAGSVTYYWTAFGHFGGVTVETGVIL